MSYRAIGVGVALSAWLAVAALTASAEGQSEAPECNSFEAEASPPCARLVQETSKWYSAASAFEQRGARKLAIETYSQAMASAKRPIELFLAGTLPAAALRRRGILYRELGQLPEAMDDFTALIDADRGNADAHDDRARTLLELGKLEGALVDSDVAVWLKPHTSDFHQLRAQILTRLDRHEEAAAAQVLAEKYAPPNRLTEFERILKGIGPKLSDQSSRSLSRERDLQEFELALRGITPIFVRQRFLLQKDCQLDDRHVLSLRFDRARVAVTSSYEGNAGTMAVEDSEEKLQFVMGAEPCQIRIVVGKGDLPDDTSPARNDSLRKALAKQFVAPDIERDFFPSSTPGCGRASTTIRVYWGSVDQTYLAHQARVNARLGLPNLQRNKLLLFTRSFGEETCRITLQVWKGA